MVLQNDDSVMHLTLSLFPSEILGSILSYQDSSHLCINLWNVGNTLLRSKLVSGMTVLHLAPVQGKLLRLPPMIYELSSLSHLALECNEEILGDPISWQSVIQRLPVTLETLSIRSPDARLALLHSKPGIKVEYVTTQYARGPSRLLDLETMFPRLRKLKIITTENYSQHPDLLPSDLPGLPSTLESLETRMLLSSPASILSLPPSLRFLLGRIVLGFEPANHPPSVWPPHLENVAWVGHIREGEKWFHMASQETRPQNMGWKLPPLPQFLPPTIRSFHLNGTDPTSNEGAWLSMLPDGLTNLSLSWIDMLDNGKLPQGLRVLHINTVFDYDKIGRLWREKGPWTANTSPWPPGLEELSFASSFVKPADLVTLPQALKLLKVNISPAKSGENEAIDLNGLFPNLTHLESNMNGILSMKPIRLPANLRQLFLKTPPPMPGDPQSSISWSAHTTSAPLLDGFAFASLLPDTLTTLSVPEWSADLFNLLPRGLLHFRAGRLPDVTAAQSSNFKTDQLFEELPPHLKTLSLGEDTLGEISQSLKIRDASAVHFKHLLSCVIADIALPSQFLRMLPQELYTLRVKLISLLPEDAPFIPPRLLHLDLGPGVECTEPHVAPYWPILVNVGSTRGNPRLQALQKDIERRRKNFHYVSKP